MRILFDTSVLVASMLQTHPRHESAVTWLQKAHSNKITLLVASHSLLECYAVLTRLPMTPKISPSIAKRLISENLLKIAEITALPADEYFSLLQDCADQHLSGGIVYDALIFKAAQFAKAQHLLTLNYKDFSRLSLATNFVITP